jgi:hypothetical protein
MSTKQFKQAAATLFASILAAETLRDDVKNATLMADALQTDAFAETLAIVKAYVEENGAADKGAVYKLAEDCMSELQALRTAELKRAGLSTKDATGKKDAICNRLAVYKNRILSGLEKRGTLEQPTPEQLKAEKETAKTTKASAEALKSAQASQGLRPVTVSELLQALSLAVTAGALDRAEWAAAKHLAMRIDAGFAAFHGTQAPMNMGDVVEVVGPALTH